MMDCCVETRRMKYVGTESGLVEACIHIFGKQQSFFCGLAPT